MKIINFFLDKLIQKIEIRNNKTKRNNLKKNIILSEGAVVYNEVSINNLSNIPEKIFIGKNTRIRGELTIWPYSDGIKIGQWCYVGKNTIIRSGERIEIGDRVLISDNVTIIDSNSHEIDAHERHQSFKKMIENKQHPNNKGNVVTASITIQDDVWISYNVSILKGVTIGEGAIIGASSVVTKDIPPFTIVAGNPARVIRTL